MNLIDTVGLLIVGAGCGFPVGRWWAEVARARHDMARTWELGDQYRGRNR